MQKQEVIAGGDLEEVLKNDPEGTHAAGIRRELGEFLVELKKHMDSGLAPDEFTRCNKLVEAAETSLAVLGVVGSALENRG